MQNEIHGQNLDVTPALREYVATRFERLGRHFEQRANTRTILSVEKSRHCAEATVNVSGRTLHADAEGQDMYTAIDLLADKLDRLLLKHKERVVDHHRGEGLAWSDATA